MLPARETERMMKLQDVILKAMAKKLRWIEAAEIAGMSVRQMHRKVAQATQQIALAGLRPISIAGSRGGRRYPMRLAFSRRRA